MRSRAARADLAVGQEKLDDVVAVGLEHHAGAAVLTDLLLGPLDHAVALAGHRRLHLATGRDLEALFSARLGLQLGHFDLLQVRFGRGKEPVPPDVLKTSVLSDQLRRHGSPFSRAARGRVYGRGLWKTQPNEN